jgi:hypothetical protein
LIYWKILVLSSLWTFRHGPPVHMLSRCGKWKPEPTTKATRCGWITRCITTCYQFLRRALLCRSKGNNQGGGKRSQWPKWATFGAFGALTRSRIGESVSQWPSLVVGLHGQTQWISELVS